MSTDVEEEELNLDITREGAARQRDEPRQADEEPGAEENCHGADGVANGADPLACSPLGRQRLLEDKRHPCHLDKRDTLCNVESMKLLAAWRHVSDHRTNKPDSDLPV
jgi:hypothetical protein